MGLGREELGFALLLSVPPGVGITGFAAAVLEGGAVTPLAVAAGFVTWLALFVLVVGSVVIGPDDPPEAAEGR